MSELLPGERITNLKFNLHKLKFVPYADNPDLTNKFIIKQIFSWLNLELIAGRGHMIDRNKGKANTDSRPLFMSVAQTDLRKNCIIGTIALLRTGRVPLLKPKDTFNLIQIDRTNGDVAERTHFFIDYSTPNCLICMEFNNNGPRLPDLEYYLRNIASEKSWAKSLKIETEMNTSLDRAVDTLSNVLSLNIKAEPKKLNNLDPDMQSYFNDMRNFGNLVKPKAVKLEAFFQQQGRKVGTREMNEDANKVVKFLLSRFQKKPELIENFDNFVVEYEDKDGHEDAVNLLKGKREIEKEVNLATLTKPKDWYTLIEADFDEYIISKK